MAIGEWAMVAQMQLQLIAGTSKMRPEAFCNPPLLGPAGRESRQGHFMRKRKGYCKKPQLQHGHFTFRIQAVQLR